MRTAPHIPFVFFLIAAGCHPPLETKEHHIVHKGEAARLVGADAVYLSVAKGGTHQLVAAAGNKDSTALNEMVASGKALRAGPGTPVRVLGESFNERHVEVTDGPLKGRDGWVPFEWLEPH